MLLAINYSPPAAALIQAGRLPVDRLKTPDWPDMIARAVRLRPVAVHFPLMAGRGRLADADWAQIETLLAGTATQYVNVHIECRTGDIPGVTVNSLHPDHREQVLAQIAADLQYVVRRFGPERVIAENIPYRPTGHAVAACADPQIIRGAIEDSGCGLLLDSAHAWISAQHLGIPWRAYISQLPTEQLREMHFTGVVDVDGWLQDHRPAGATDWEVIEWCLAEVRQHVWPTPGMLAFEYGGEGGKFTEHSLPDVIETQTSRLYDLVHSL